jgi:hypothetical protein
MMSAQQMAFASHTHTVLARKSPSATTERSFVPASQRVKSLSSFSKSLVPVEVRLGV